jgi:hypothetical protein
MRYFLPLFSLALGQPLFSEEIIEQLRARLSDTCGDQCISFFDEVLPMVANITVTGDEEDMKARISGFHTFLNNITQKAQKDQMEILASLSNITAPSPRSSQKSLSPDRPITSFSNVTMPPPAQPGLPCRTQTECNGITFGINRCSFIREAAQNAYAGANTAVSVLANMMAVLCGCVFVGPVKQCVLIGVPYTCGFPFTAYQGLFSLSEQLWAAVTLTSAVCASVGPDSPALAG